MKLQFRILRLPTDEGLQPKAGCDNIPLVDPRGTLWFLWSPPLGRLLRSKYILKKLA